MSLVKIPSLSSVVKVPTLPGLPGVPLICGANETLAKLEGIRSQILEKLSSKRSALEALATQVGVAKSTIDQLKQIEQTAFSLQNDVAGLLNNPTPSQISSFLNRWGTKLPNAELQSLIGKIGSFTSGQATLNLCVDVPNFKLKGLEGVLEKDAPVATVPNVNPPAPVVLTPTVVDSTKSVSTGESGVTPADVEGEMKLKVFDAYSKQVTIPASLRSAALSKDIRELWNTKDGKSLTKKIEKYGKKANELQEAGLLTPSEVAVASRLREAVKKRETFRKSWAELNEYFTTYIGVVGAGGPEKGTKDGGVLLKKWQKELSENKDIAEYYAITNGLVDSNSELIVKWSAYILNKPKAS